MLQPASDLERCHYFRLVEILLFQKSTCNSRELDQVSPTFSWVFNGFEQAIAWLPVSVKCA
jgi:hypothetical protein